MNLSDQDNSASLYDYAVVGLGAVGSSALYHLSQSGKKVVGIDRFHPPHTLGSSHGETRITRLAVGEGEEYVDLAKRSHELWDEIQMKTQTVLRVPCGGVMMDSGLEPWEKHGAEGFLKRTISFAERGRIEHEVLVSKELRKRFPNFNLEDQGKAYLEFDAGYVLPEKCIEAQLNLARQNGAQIIFNSPVLQNEEKDGAIHLKTATETLHARKVLLCAGGWIKDFLPQNQKKKFTICRQILHWLELDEENQWTDHPVFMWGFGPQPEDFIYGFPSLDGKSIKVATESFLEASHPDGISRTVSKQEQGEFWEKKIKGRINGLTGKILRSEVCFYTVTEDAKFVIKEHPDFENLTMVSACSGHGFKHSAALGEFLAQKIQGKQTTVPDFT